MKTRSFLFGAVVGLVAGASLAAVKVARLQAKLAHYDAQEAAMAAHRAAREELDTDIKVDWAAERLG